MSDFILSVNEISKSYQTSISEKLTVLNSVDLSIAAGDLVGLTAPSGAGKSTLLHICGLLDTCDSGTINFLGRDLQKASDLKRTLIRICLSVSPLIARILSIRKCCFASVN